MVDFYYVGIVWWSEVVSDPNTERSTKLTDCVLNVLIDARSTFSTTFHTAS